MKSHDVSLLTEGQKACLRLVMHHMGSKDIARVLDISPHTVDARLKAAMKILGVTGRVEAAQILALREDTSPYQPLAYQSPVFAAASNDDTSDLGDGVARHPGFGYSTHPSSLDAQRAAEFAALGEARQVFMPFPVTDALPPRFRAWGGRNDLTVLQRLVIAMAIAIGSAMGFGAILAGLEALSRVS